MDVYIDGMQFARLSAGGFKISIWLLNDMNEPARAVRRSQVLYTSEITDESPAAIAEGDRRLAEDGPLPEYALDAACGAWRRIACAIDKHLAATSENWSLARMPIVDRSILRLATFEMMYVDDVPTSVTDQRGG